MQSLLQTIGPNREDWKQGDQILTRRPKMGAWTSFVILEIEGSGSIGDII